MVISNHCIPVRWHSYAQNFVPRKTRRIQHPNDGNHDEEPTKKKKKKLRTNQKAANIFTHFTEQNL